MREDWGCVGRRPLTRLPLLKPSPCVITRLRLQVTTARSEPAQEGSKAILKGQPGALGTAGHGQMQPQDDLPPWRAPPSRVAVATERRPEPPDPHRRAPSTRGPALRVGSGVLPKDGRRTHSPPAHGLPPGPASAMLATTGDLRPLCIRPSASRGRPAAAQGALRLQSGSGRCLLWPPLWSPSSQPILNHK